MRSRALSASFLAFLAILAVGPAVRAADLDACLAAQGLPRVVRVRAPDGPAHYAIVIAEAEGVPARLAPLAGGDVALGEVFDRAARARSAPAAATWEIAPGELAARLCSPVPLDQDAIDGERRVVVAAGLNYAAHAEEAGGGDVFLFPKPSAPTSAYGSVVPPPGVTLLDYEVELAFVLLEDVALASPPSRAELLARSAFFVANDVSDREPIIREKALRGPGTGFVQAKGLPGFLPAGPWMVRGTELFAALEACGAAGLGIALEVDEGQGFRPRQRSTTARMILDPAALLARIAEEVAAHGLRSPMPLVLAGRTRHYPLAVDASAPRLPAGSLVLTGTPDGVALQAPSPAGVTLRGLLHLRSPFAQFLAEEKRRAAAGGPGGYLEPGDRVRARIDGLGTQNVRIAAAPAPPPSDPCTRTEEASP